MLTHQPQRHCRVGGLTGERALLCLQRFELRLLGVDLVLDAEQAIDRARALEQGAQLRDRRLRR